MPSLSWSWPWSSERFSSGSFSVGDPAFAAWLRGDDGDSESVSPYTILGLSAVLRAVSIISSTIAGLPLRTYERRGDERDRIDSVFDDPYPGFDGLTRFAWVETIVIHLLLWRNAYLWHDDRDSLGEISVYRPLVPDGITVKREDGKRRFKYRDSDGTTHEVGHEWITHIPGPSIDGVAGHPFLHAARSVFSGVLSGDKAAARTLRLGIRLAGLVTPKDGEDVPPEEAKQILSDLRASIVGHEHAGDIGFINRRLELQKWTPTNIDSQWMEARAFAVAEVGRIFGIPPHLLNDIEKQTSWGTGVAEQNLGLARFTLMGWTGRIEGVLSRRLPDGQFVEFDYTGLLQGTPETEIKLLLAQVEAGLLTLPEARRIRNLPPLTPAELEAAEARRMGPRPLRARPTPLLEERSA